MHDDGLGGSECQALGMTLESITLEDGTTLPRELWTHSPKPGARSWPGASGSAVIKQVNQSVVESAIFFLYICYLLGGVFTTKLTKFLFKKAYADEVLSFEDQHMLISCKSATKPRDTFNFGGPASSVTVLNHAEKCEEIDEKALFFAYIKDRPFSTREEFLTLVAEGGFRGWLKPFSKLKLKFQKYGGPLDDDTQYLNVKHLEGYEVDLRGAAFKVLERMRQPRVRAAPTLESLQEGANELMNRQRTAVIGGTKWMQGQLGYGVLSWCNPDVPEDGTANVIYGLNLIQAEMLHPSLLENADYLQMKHLLNERGLVKEGGLVPARAFCCITWTEKEGIFMYNMKTEISRQVFTMKTVEGEKGCDWVVLFNPEGRHRPIVFNAKEGVEDGACNMTNKFSNERWLTQSTSEMRQKLAHRQLPEDPQALLVALMQELIPRMRSPPTEGSMGPERNPTRTVQESIAVAVTAASKTRAEHGEKYGWAQERRNPGCGGPSMLRGNDGVDAPTPQAVAEFIVQKRVEFADDDEAYLQQVARLTGRQFSPFFVFLGENVGKESQADYVVRAASLADKAADALKQYRAQQEREEHQRAAQEKEKEEEKGKKRAAAEASRAAGVRRSKRLSG